MLNPQKSIINIRDIASQIAFLTEHHKFGARKIVHRDSRIIASLAQRISESKNVMSHRLQAPRKELRIDDSDNKQFVEDLRKK